MIGTGKSGGSGADNGHFFLFRRFTFNFHLPGIKFIGRQALQIPNGHRRFNLAATAGILAPVGADATQYTGQRQVFHDDLQGFLILTLFDHLHVALHIETARAGQPTGGFVGFLDGISAGNGLGVLLEGGFFGTQTFVVFARKIHRTDRGALTTAGTLVKINVAGVLTYPGLEITGLAFKI